MIIATLQLGTHIDINSINEANIYRQRRNRHKRIETNDGRRGEKDTRMEEKERVENQRNIFTVIPCEEGRENEKVEMFYGSGLRGKIKEKRGTNSRRRRRWRPSFISPLSLPDYSREPKLNNREVI